MRRQPRKLKCAGCAKDLTAVQTKVASPLHKGSQTTALRAPPRIEITVQYAGKDASIDYTVRPAFTAALCPDCAGRITFTSEGIPLAIEPKE